MIKNNNKTVNKKLFKKLTKNCLTNNKKDGIFKSQTKREENPKYTGETKLAGGSGLVLIGGDEKAVR